jgi:hypothetical protein
MIPCWREKINVFWLLLCVLVVAERKKMNVIGYITPCTYCVQVVAERKKIICILPSVPVSLFQRGVMYILVHWFSFGANFHHLMTRPKKNIYILFDFYKGILEKMCQSCQILRESSLRLSSRDSEF